MEKNSNYYLTVNKLKEAFEKGLCTREQYDEVLDQLEHQLPEVQCLIVDNKYPLRYMEYFGKKWVVAKDVFQPFPNYEPGKHIDMFPDDDQTFITGKSPHGKETFYCITEAAMLSLIDAAKRHL
jgi:hypothetical protein